MCLAYNNGRLWVCYKFEIKSKSKKPSCQVYLQNVALQLRNDMKRLVLSLIEAVLIRKDPTSSYQKLATDFNSKTHAVRISK
ncbi:hypothetical protein BpHYR1_052587 [Brachionus plicatilis]|uniref:Uncharacterized protein n=1 Tax=Brachionus plicatilis TaxID=10195 RepID=A0A3M7S433_BRAPC|nr:hypothetical protein BpHYR1_052587 [Brachionus plicatilis]